MNPTDRIWNRSPIRLARQAAALAVALLVFLVAGTALAVDQPPETAPQQRAWLLSHLVTDMQSVGSFQNDDIARMVTLVNALTDDQVSLLARFYYLTREKAEEDARLYAVQQTGDADALAQAKAQVADLLAQLQSQIQQTYSEVATVSPGCQTLCQVAYASVPGWCAHTTSTPSPTRTTMSAATSARPTRRPTAAPTPCRSTSPSTTTAAATTIGAAEPTCTITSHGSGMERIGTATAEWLRELLLRAPSRTAARRPRPATAILSRRREVRSLRSVARRLRSQGASRSP